MLIKNLNKFWLLSWIDRGRFLQSILLLPVIHYALSAMGYSRLYAMMEKLTPVKNTGKSSSKVEKIQRAQEIARIVSIAAQHGFYKASCLRKSMVVWWLLRKEGFQSKICFGVRKINARLEAHAWVEVEGMVVNDSVDIHEQYQPLEDALPPIKFGL